MTILSQSALRRTYGKVAVVCDMQAKTVKITKKGEPFKTLAFRDVTGVGQINGHLKSAVVHEKLKPYESFTVTL